MPFVLDLAKNTPTFRLLASSVARRATLVVLWGFVAFAVVFAALGISGAAGVALIVAAFAVAHVLLIFYARYRNETERLSETLQSAVLRVRRGETVNFTPFLAYEVREVLFLDESLAPSLLQKHFLKTQRAQHIFQRLGLTHDAFDVAFSKISRENSVTLPRLLEDAAARALRFDRTRVHFSDMLITLLSGSPILRQFLFDWAIELEDVEVVCEWEDHHVHADERRRAFWSRENLLAITPFGRTWAYGYTPLLDQYAQDWVHRLDALASRVRFAGRAREIRALEHALVKAANANALVIGEPGVGVDEVLRGFATRVVAGASLPALNYRRILGINLTAAVSGLSSAVKAEGRARQLLEDAARAGGTILILEDFHTVLGSEAGGGAVDLTAVLRPFLEGVTLQIVATTTYEGLHEVIEKREVITSLFERIEVKEPDQPETIRILLEMVPDFEKRFHIFIPYSALKSVVTYADRTIQDVPFPRKAVDVLEGALLVALAANDTVLTDAHVANVIFERTEVPVGALTKQEQEKLLGLETFIHKRIVGQNEAVRVLANAFRRARTELTAGATTRPIGSFLFLGPTGVGKTETAKALAEAYFGSEERMVRLDMSEFQGVDALEQLIGSPATREEGRLTTAIRENPFTLLLLDEFEKVSPKALDLFLPIFDEGRIEDGWGRRVAFTNTLIIATSNAGAEFIREYIQKKGDPQALAAALREEILRRGLFRPELLNRFDGVVVFQPLTKVEVREIAKRILQRFVEHVEREKGITVVVEDAALDAIVYAGFDQEFGARELRRVLQDTVETVVARKILEGAKRGEIITITQGDWGSS